MLPSRVRTLPEQMTAPSAGVLVWIDNSAQIAHTKTMAIDGAVTLSGSLQLDCQRRGELGGSESHRLGRGCRSLRGTLAGTASGFRPPSPDVKIGAGPDMCSRFARLFWVALDRVDHAVVVSGAGLVDLIYGPEPPTPADEKRDADRKQLPKAFTGTDFDGWYRLPTRKGTRRRR
jgi:hypothetical protein